MTHPFRSNMAPWRALAPKILAQSWGFKGASLGQIRGGCGEPEGSTNKLLGLLGLLGLGSRSPEAG